MSSSLAVMTLLAGLLCAAAPPETPDEPTSGGFIRRADGSEIRIGGAAPPKPKVEAPRDAGVDAGVDVEKRLFELTNAARRRHGRKPLQAEETLAALARGHSADMLRRGFLSHVNPDGLAPADRVAVGHRRLVGEVSENVWTGSKIATDDPAELAQKILDGLMASPQHRENLLRAGYTHLGVGVVREEGEIRATQKFATVWAWLNRPVPQRVSLAAPPDLRATPYLASVAPRRFDLVRPKSRQPAMDPVLITSRRFDVPAGTYRLRFYFPKGKGSAELWIVGGPEIVVGQ